MKTEGRLLRNFLVVFTGSIVGQLFFVLGIVWVARGLGPEMFGWWAFAQAILFYLLRAGEFGLEVVGIRTIARYPQEISSQISQVVATRLLMGAGIVLTTGCAVLLGLVPREARELVFVFSLCVFPIAVGLEWVFEGVQEVYPLAASRLLRGGIFAVLVMVFVGSPSDGMNAAIAYFVSVSLPVFFLLIVVGKVTGFHWTFPKPFRGFTLLREALPIGAATICSQYSLFFGTTILGYFGSGHEVGIFGAAHRIIIFVWAYGIVTSNRILLPSLSQYFSSSILDFRGLLSQATRMLVILAVLVGVVGVLVAPEAIPWIFGKEYAASSIVFSILIWTLVVGMGRSALEVSLIASDRQKVFFNGMLLLAGLHTVLDLCGYLLSGIEGLAWGVLSAEIAYSLWIGLRVARQWLDHPWNNIGVPLSLGAVTLIGAYVLEQPAVVQAILAALVYTALLAASGTITRDDLNIVREAARGLRARGGGHL